MSGMTYSTAGVDIDRADRFTEFIKGIGSSAVSKGIGGFAAGFEIDTTAYRHPVVLSTTDGVGTKLLVARTLGRYDTVGIDLVAMCVNDLVVCGAMPVSFLDYIACRAIDPNILEPLMMGIVKGCEIAGCALSGGETAEMPGLYSEDDFDVAGFCWGIVERDDMIPKKEAVRTGDLLLGIPSNGIHSNGFSLARRVIPPADAEIYRQLLTPTRIYVREMKHLLSTGAVLAAAHITGGGLVLNTVRVLPESLTPSFDFAWKEPSIFGEIRRRGGVEEEEMRRVFNLGIGIVLVVHPEDRETVFGAASEHGFEILEVGRIIGG